MDQSSKNAAPSSSHWSASDLPSMSPDIDAYLTEVVTSVSEAERREKIPIRTTDYTLTDFKATKAERMWAMKESGEMVDAVLVTADGHREPVHIDMLLQMEKEMTPFFKQTTAASSPAEYAIDPSLSRSLLQQMVFFAYHRRCDLPSLSVSGALELALTAAKFSVHSLVLSLLPFLVESCSLESALKVFMLAGAYVAKGGDQGKKHMATVQAYVLDNFEQLWAVSRSEVLSLDASTLSSLLSSDQLDAPSEQLVWSVIEQWTAVDVPVRGCHLPALLTHCLRLGRLPVPFARDAVLGGPLVGSLSPAHRSLLSAHLGAVLAQGGTVPDGQCLPFSLSSAQHRPRQTKQYLLCAGGWTEGRTTASLELWDYQRQLWLSSALSLPHPVAYFGLQLFGADRNLLGLFGGSSGTEILKSLHVLHLGGGPGPAVWQSKCSMIERRCYATSVVLGDGCLLVLGGFNGRRRMRRVERYDPRLDTWTELAPMTLARSDAAAVLLGGLVYVAGGINDAAVEASLEVYCPLADHWRPLPAMASPRTSLALASFRGRLWAVGGNDGNRRLNTAASFHPTEQQWREEASLGGPHGRSTFRAIVLNDELFAVGGFNGEMPVKTVEKYVNGSWQPVTSLLHDRSGHSLISLPRSLALPFTA